MRPLKNNFLAAAFAALLMSAPAMAEDSPKLSARMEDERIVVMIGDQEFTSYLFGEQHKYPFFHPVTGPASGKTLTTWDQEPFPHHSSLYISLDRVRSESVRHANYWQPRDNLSTGQVFSRKPEIVSQDDGKVVLRDETEWIVPASGVHQLSDTRVVTITAPKPGIRLMDFRFDLKAEKDLVFGQTGHSFFSARMRPEIAVGCRRLGADWADLGTGTVIDSLGGRNEEGTRERAADWAAAFGTLDGHVEGLAIIQHSSNPMYPAKWFMRDYGFMSPTPFAFDGNTPIKGGETLTFRYRVVVFTGDPEEADIAGWREDFESGADDHED